MYSRTRCVYELLVFWISIKNYYFCTTPYVFYFIYTFFRIQYVLFALVCCSFTFHYWIPYKKKKKRLDIIMWKLPWTIKCSFDIMIVRRTNSMCLNSIYLLWLFAMSSRRRSDCLPPSQGRVCCAVSRVKFANGIIRNKLPYSIID